MLTGQRDKDTGTAVNGTAQKVTIGMKNGNYYPNTLTVNAGQPVELALDSSVAGCFRSFTIRELGISKYVKTLFDFDWVHSIPTILILTTIALIAGRFKFIQNLKGSHELGNFAFYYFGFCFYHSCF